MEIYELRRYDVMPGRMADLHMRMRDTAPPLFARNGLPKPAAIWQAIAGPTLPAYLYLLRWPDMGARQAAFDRQYADPDRPTTRDAHGAELTTRIHLSFLRPAECWPATQGKHGIGGVHELIIQRIANQRLPMAQQALTETDLPALQREGAVVLGIFESWMGLVRPGLITFLAWPDMVTRERAWATLARDAKLSAVRQRETEIIGKPLFGTTEVYLLQPADYGLPRPGFGHFHRS